MNKDFSSPIELSFKSAKKGGPSGQVRTFNSYSFDKNVLIPASPFRFTAPGVTKSERTALRSGDMVELFVALKDGTRRQIATGYLDETDTHVVKDSVEYVLTGRDVMGQLVDNSAVDAQNAIVNTTQMRLTDILKQLIQNTRIPQQFIVQQVPNGTLLYQTNPGETKISALQRYLEFANCLIWAAPNGQVVLGRPDFTRASLGNLRLNRSDPSTNNILEARSRRNLNMAIRQIVTQIQTATLVHAAPFTVNNEDADVKEVRTSLVGKSVYRTFSYGNGNDTINQIIQVGNGSGSPFEIGHALSLREIARENMKVLDVELVVQGHLGPSGNPLDIDQIYNVQIEDDDVGEDMYVYACRYDLTMERGRMTTLRLCRLGTIVAYADQVRRST